MALFENKVAVTLAGVGLITLSAMAVLLQKLSETLERVSTKTERLEKKVDKLLVLVRKVGPVTSKAMLEDSTTERELLTAGTNHERTDVPSCWKKEEVKQWIIERLNNYKEDEKVQKEIGAKFSDIDGVMLKDLVFDDAHGFHLLDKLYFMGIPTQLCRKLSEDMNALFSNEKGPGE